MRTPTTLIHQKIRLQSAKRRLQSCGKSTYSHSRATIPGSHPSQMETTASGGPPTPIRNGKGTSESAQELPIQRAMAAACKHPKVRIVSRHEDTEYVECLECGEVFDSEEFRDMEIEETAEPEEALDDE